MLRLKWRHVMIKINWIFLFSVFCWVFLFGWVSEALMQPKKKLYYFLDSIFVQTFGTGLIKISKEIQQQYKTSAYPMRTKSLRNKQRRRTNIVHKLTADCWKMSCQRKKPTFLNQKKPKHKNTNCILFFIYGFYFILFVLFLFRLPQKPIKQYKNSTEILQK